MNYEKFVKEAERGVEDIVEKDDGDGQPQRTANINEMF